jgi:hypothetical protein
MSAQAVALPVLQRPERIIIQPGDVFFTRSYTWLGRIIRRFERSKGEAESVANHVGMFLAPVAFLEHVMSIEALARVRNGRFWDFYHGKNIEVAIYRDKTLQPGDLWLIQGEAHRFRGRMYGFAKIGLHAIDWTLARALGRQDVYAARRLARLDRYPICSYLVAKAYSAVDRNFGCSPSAAQPDDMWDFVNAHPEKWECVLPLQKI